MCEGNQEQSNITGEVNNQSDETILNKDGLSFNHSHQCDSLNQQQQPKEEEEEEEEIRQQSDKEEQENISNTSDLTNDILSTSTSNHFYEQQQANHRASVHPEFIYNRHNESIFDDHKIFPCLPTNNIYEDIVKYDDNNPELISHATLTALIVQMTSPEIIDYNLICDFFLTYRMFTNNKQDVLQLFLTRLIWSLQYINSSIDENVKIGKLVLLRTFVVLRHWIINYFVDDFHNNYQLCDLFTTTMNSITLESNLVIKQDKSTSKVNDNDFMFTTKILGDLKIHWLKIINDFWLLELDMDTIISSPNAHAYFLPLSSFLSANKKLSKSNTEISIHTNPSFRRSAMLSLYDTKTTPHKMLIFDDDDIDQYDDNMDNSPGVNPQFSINNLLLHHHSSRTSINNKVQQIQQQKKLLKSPTFTNYGLSRSPLISSSNNNLISPISTTPSSPIAKKPLKKILAQATRHNHMNVKDSSLDLKKTKNVPKEDSADQENIDPESLQPMTTNSEVGFSTNGHLKLPTSKVTTIVPPSPVKHSARTSVQDTESIFLAPPPHNNDLPLQPPSIPTADGGSDLNRRGSIRRMMDNWKKTLGTHKHTGSEVSSMAIASEESTENLNSLINDAINVMHEKTEIGSRIDALSARVIDELEYLIRYYIGSEHSSIIHELEPHDLVPPPPQQHEQQPQQQQQEEVVMEEKGEVDLHPIEISASKQDDSEMDINDLSDLNIVKIDNLVNDNENNTSVHNVKVPRNLSSSNILDDEDNNNIEISKGSSFQSPTSINWNEELEASLDKTPLDEEFDDFDFSMEEPLRKIITSTMKPEPFQRVNHSFETSSISTPSNITQYDAEVQDLGIAMSPQGNNKPKRISFCDNNHASITYSKRLSVWSRNSTKSYITYDSAFSMDSNSVKMDDNEFSNGLKKKTGFNNLRTLGGTTAAIRNSMNSDPDFPTRQNSCKSNLTRKSTRYSTFNVLTELPFFEDFLLLAGGIDNMIAAGDSSIFSLALKSSTRKESFVTSSSNNSVAIPGISSFALKELAAIPDESISSSVDAIQYALHKLEGKSASNMTLKRDKEKEVLQSPSQQQSQQQQIQEEENTKGMSPPSTPAPEFQPPTKNNTPYYPSPSIILQDYTTSNDLLSVASILSNSSHISFLLSYDSETLARHFTAIEKDIIENIDWLDILDGNYNKQPEAVVSWLEVIGDKGINLVIQRFNMMVNFIISTILLTRKGSERLVLVRRLIRVGECALELQNFSLLMAIVVALNSERIAAVTEGYGNVDDEEMSIFRKLEKVCSPSNNFINLRRAINNVDSKKGCIPFLGLSLSDLTFNNERPSFINGREIINFAKFRTSVHIVKSLSQCIEWSNNYRFEIDDELLSKCLYISSLNEDEMNYCIGFLRKHL
ncbi:LOW QUALITY PROTEIN: LTE1 Guanine nucleotide exchange factor LTE1 [Candida maltosa Xu316]